ncbi:MAG: AAC(3) family N-acetyltransferase [Rhodospirillales bacterium]
MPKLTLDDAAKALNDIIAPDDGIVVIHSGIWSFALKFGITTPEDVDGFIDLIASVVGERTLLMPAYNFEFPRTKVFDLTLSPPQVGILPERAWTRLGMKRTRQPMNSYFVCGPDTDAVLALPCTTAWGDDGVMGWMGRHNARLCSLGLPWEKSISYVHRCEQLAGVPYRYFKKFTGRLCDNGENLGPCTEVFFTRPMHHHIDEDWSAPFDLLERQGRVLRATSPEIPFASVLARDIEEACMRLLADDPYALVKDPAHLKEWVSSERDAELAAIDPSQRWP